MSKHVIFLCFVLFASTANAFDSFNGLTKVKDTNFLDIFDDKKTNLLNIFDDKKTNLMNIFDDKKTNLMNIFDDKRTNLLNIFDDKKTNLLNIFGNKDTDTDVFDWNIFNWNIFNILDDDLNKERNDFNDMEITQMIKTIENVKQAVKNIDDKLTKDKDEFDSIFSTYLRGEKRKLNKFLKEGKCLPLHSVQNEKLKKAINIVINEVKECTDRKLSEKINENKEFIDTINDKIKSINDFKENSKICSNSMEGKFRNIETKICLAQQYYRAHKTHAEELQTLTDTKNDKLLNSSQFIATLNDCSRLDKLKNFKEDLEKIKETSNCLSSKPVNEDDADDKHDDDYDY